MAMNHLEPSVASLKVLAGEGGFNMYRLINGWGRYFIFVKLLLTSFSYFWGKGSSFYCEVISFVKGDNQLRYHSFVENRLIADFGRVQSVSCRGRGGCVGFPRFSIDEFFLQFYFLGLLLLSGRRRYLNLYLLSFQNAMERIVSTDLGRVEIFVCYNDQPFDVAAIVESFNRRKLLCRTIVIQHGLILNEKFYFPSVASEFWAWGSESIRHYCSWRKSAQIFVKGRYLSDASIRADNFCSFSNGGVNLLVAPSFFHQEIKNIARNISVLLGDKNGIFVAIKFHPATKFKWILKLWCMIYAIPMREEIDSMEVLSKKYDILLTKNSSSAVDFLLSGKIVSFLEFNEDAGFPSVSFGFSLKEIEDILGDKGGFNFHSKNIGRRQFLKKFLNV